MPLQRRNSLKLGGVSLARLALEKEHKQKAQHRQKRQQKDERGYYKHWVYL